MLFRSDGLRYGLITIDELLNIELFKTQHDIVVNKHPSLSQRRMIHEVIRRMINVMVVDLIDTSRKNIEQAGLETIDDVRQQHQPLMSFSENMNAQKLELKQFLRTRLYQHYQVHRMSKKAGAIIQALFDAFMDDTRILHPETRESCIALEKPKVMPVLHVALQITLQA